MGRSKKIVISLTSGLQRRASARWALLGLGLLLALSSACRDQASRGMPAVFSSISFTNQEGAALSPDELADRVLVVNLMFTSCSSVCPRQTRELAEVTASLPKALTERVRFLSITVDPDNDDSAALKRFARANGAERDGWLFLRTDTQATELLGSRLVAFAPDTQPTPWAHGTTIYLFDRGGRLVQRYRGAPIDVAHLAREILAVDDLKPSGARLASN